MGSKTRTYDQKKLFGQVYTPRHIVEKILTDSEFYAADLTNKTILDPACGDGRFLVVVVEHIVKTTPPEALVSTLLNVHGWDIDPEALSLCRQNLDELVAPLAIKVNWNLARQDALRQINSGNRFDFILGNPPYIRIQHLPLVQRKFIQTHYSFCQNGSTDAYVAFFQLASLLLKENGVCAFITPNSYFGSQTGKQLRTYFQENQNLKIITNYGSIPVFNNASTYPAITVFGKTKASSFRYELCKSTDFQYIDREIPFLEIQRADQWQLSLTQTVLSNGQRLGDISRISVGITTLADGYYLFSILSENGSLVKAQSKSGATIELERDILKPIVKASRLKTSDDPVTEYVLFPYTKDAAGKHRIIPEDVLKEKFPHTFSYLLKVKPALDRRDNGKPNAVAWYAFGRAQGLDSSFGKKIVFSPMNLYPNFVLYENPEATMYSGYFIKYDGDYDALLEQLNSQRMADFIAVSGRDFQGGYKGYNKKVVENFIVTNHS
jgi:adenine-specific DNA-methyltransferase